MGIMVKYKKIEIKPVEVIKEVPLQYWVYKAPNRLFLMPVPYIAADVSREIKMLIKFCKNAN